MSLPQQFLDELRSRITLSTLIGASIKVEKAGREHKACCPFHSEKSPSFTINDDKGFYHCFGCSAHGDALRWMTDHRGLPFMDAVRELAMQVGLDVPAPSPEVAQREKLVDDVATTLAKAGAWYARQLGTSHAARQHLAERGVTAEQIERFGIGYAGAQISGSGLAQEALVAADLLREGEGHERGLWRDRFFRRIMVPIHDHRGRAVGFGARALGDAKPKYLNSPDAPHFDKGRLLFNMHRAAPAARSARRLIVVEGYFDVIALDRGGIAEAVAPMGTALTEAQLERCWRVANVPVLCFDGDAAGMAAAMRACERAMPALGPGRSLAIARMPEGRDPDDVVRELGGAGMESILLDAAAISDFIWDAVLAEGDRATPEGRAAIWKRLADMAAEIRDDETRAQYGALWRGRYDEIFPPAPLWLKEEMLPVGSVEALSAQSEGVQARLKAVSAKWLERRIAVLPADATKLYQLAWTVGRRVGAGLLAEDDARAVLTAQLERIADAQGDELDKSLGDGMNRAFDIGPMLTDMKCSGFPRTDMGNAERFHARFGHDFRFTTAKGWLGWDGRRWKVLDQDEKSTPAEVLAAVFDTVRAIQSEAGFVEATGLFDADENPHGMNRLGAGEKKPELLSVATSKWGRTSEASGKLGCIAGLAKRWLTVPIERFDCDPLAINVLNGTLRFTRTAEGGQRVVTMELDPHRREDLNTKLAPVEFDREAQSPIYDDFFAWAQPDKAMRRYLHQWGGYSASGDTSEQKLHFWYGLGGNGKSTVIDAWCKALGDYTGTIGIETFLDQGIKKRGEQASPDLARLGGVRLLRTSEPERGAKLNAALIKAATGGEPMAVRALHRGFFDLLPLFKLTISGNFRPDIPDTDNGIWRRIRLIGWDKNIETEFDEEGRPKKDEDLPNKIAKELPGIFLHLMRGLYDWLKNGLVEPEAVAQATAEYREDSDPLARFLKLCTEADKDARVQSSRLHEVFQAWCKPAGEREWTQKGFSKAMLDKGFKKKASDGMQWIGLKLVKQATDFVDEHGRARVAPDEPPPSADAASVLDDDDDDGAAGLGGLA